MKTIIHILTVVLCFSITSYSQTLSNWKHYYAPDLYGGLEFGNYFANNGPEEILLLDKSTLVTTRIPFPPEARQISHHDSLGMPYLMYGPGNTLIIRPSSSPAILYDGVNWSPFPVYLGLNTDSISFFHNQGGNQFFTYNRSLCMYDGSTITYFDSSNSPYDAQNYYLSKFSSNNNIFLSSLYNVSIYRNGSWATYDTAFFGLPNLNVIATVSPLNDFMFYYGSSSILYIFSNSSGNWNSISIPASVCHNAGSVQIYSTIYDTNGNLWITGNKIFCMYDGTQFYDYYSNIPWISNSDYLIINSILSANNLLVKFNYVNYIYNTAINSLIMLAADPMAALSGNEIYPSLKDNNGNLWFGSVESSPKDGLMKYSNHTWYAPPLNANGIYGGIYAIIQDTGSSIVFGYGDINSDGPILYDGTNFTLLNDNLHSFSQVVVDISIDQNHHYWFGGGGAQLIGVTEFFNGTITFHQCLGSSEQPYAIAIDSLDNKWVSFNSYDGVYELTGSVWTHYNMANSPLPNDTVVKIILQPNTNILWFCTSNGFARYDNGSWTIFDTTNSPLPGNRAEYVYWDSNGIQWFTTQRGGFATLYNNTWNTYTVFNSPLDNADVESIVVDDNCTAWLCTEGGITTVDIGCAPPQGIIVNGIVNQFNSSPAQNALVRIYKLNGNGTDIIQVDNTFTNSAGQFNYFSNDTTSSYYFRVDANDLAFPGQLAVYEDSAIVVQQAIQLHFPNSGNYNVSLKMVQKYIAIGTITFKGKLLSTTERTGSVYLVLMLNGQPVASAISNVDGTFNFPNIAAGNYEVWVDKIGLNNAIAPVVSIDSTSNSIVYYFQLYPGNLDLLTTGIKTASILSKINIFPNPCSDKIAIRIPDYKNEQIDLKIYDGFGVFIMEKEINSSVDIDIKNIPVGVYFLKIQMNGNIITKKIVKI